LLGAVSKNAEDWPLSSRQKREIEIFLDRLDQAYKRRKPASPVQVVQVPDFGAEDVKRVRESLDVSQSMFAKMLGVSGILVRSWEQGSRKPTQASCRLLDLIDANPAGFKSRVLKEQKDE
jgi:DNA-binding transcriptional regulator YiaG